ncbi:MAG: HEAT repeat domain-containing protein [Halodesulfurarchaeum sp.]
MSDGDEAGESEVESTVAGFEKRLESARAALEAAETEDDLDDVDATVEAITADLEAAEIPVEEPKDEEEEPEDPKEPLEDDISSLQDGIEKQRGPYGEDVIDAIEEIRSTITDTRWAEEGEDELVPGVQTFIETAADVLEADFGEAVPDPEELAIALDSIAEAVESAAYDADEDAEAIAELLEATGALESDVEAATAWTDLEIRERLYREGFYEPIEDSKHKDFPPEWSALKTWEKRGNVEMVTLLLELMGDTDFIARHCIEALEYMGEEAGIDALGNLAKRRNLNAIDAIGKIGAEAGIEHLESHAESGTSDELQARSLIALGAIGSESTTQLVADQLHADSKRVRTAATRALGMIGDPRSVAPLAALLAEEESDLDVRAGAAFALREIGTEQALETVAEYRTASSYRLEQEAERAAAALGLDEPSDDDSDEETESAEGEETDETRSTEDTDEATEAA